MSEPIIKEEVQQSIREDEGIDDEYVDEFIDILDAKYRDLEFDDELVSLTRMDIEGFKVIDELDVSISDRATIIHGRNSKGKSSFIEATRFNLFGRDNDDPLITRPINRNYKKLKTDGYWRKGRRNYQSTGRWSGIRAMKATISPTSSKIRGTVNTARRSNAPNQKSTT
ncbi:AAA family ATPase [Haloplanus litoreus]|uniref:AAA family ATPase n=1 Tax=Haloplanus litoreus TaxID=767515 RepID=A0ABD6A3I4_9EURY